jgi:hypothetical protein
LLLASGLVGCEVPAPNDALSERTAAIDTGGGTVMPPPVMPPPPSGGPTVPPATPQQMCCICLYDPATCGGAKSKNACDTAGGTYTTCTWNGTSCESPFLQQCKDAQAADNCDAAHSVIQPYTTNPADPLYGLTGCTWLDYKYFGHGKTCSTWAQKIQVCVNKAPSCSTFDFTIGGCDVFEDLSKARARMQAIQATLPPGTSVIWSSNQCWSSSACQSMYTFQGTTMTLTETAAPCHLETDFCYNPNQDAICSTGNGMTNEICCCPSGSGAYPNNQGCHWVVGKLSC